MALSSRTVTLTEIRACPLGRLDPGHYLSNEHGCDCIQDPSPVQTNSQTSSTPTSTT